MESVLFALCLLGLLSRCGVATAVPDTFTRSSFKRVNVTNAQQLGAVCNDHSQGIYYISKTASSKKWIIHLEGNVGCGSVEDCNRRYDVRPQLMSSHYYPTTIRGRDIFDPDPTINPDYWDYNMVLIPYCTSDLWLGNSSWIPDSVGGYGMFPFNSSAKFVFRGSALFRSVVGELLKEEMDSADDVSTASYLYRKTIQV
jgi:hypothetical protein